MDEENQSLWVLGLGPGLSVECSLPESNELLRVDDVSFLEQPRFVDTLGSSPSPDLLLLQHESVESREGRDPESHEGNPPLVQPRQHPPSNESTGVSRA